MTLQELRDNIIRYHISKPIIGYYMSNPEQLEQLTLEDLINKGYVTQNYYIEEIRKKLKSKEPRVVVPDVLEIPKPIESEITEPELVEEQSNDETPVETPVETETIEHEEEQPKDETPVIEEKPKVKKTTKSKK